MKLASITFPISDLNWHKKLQKYFVSVTWGAPFVCSQRLFVHFALCEG